MASLVFKTRIKGCILQDKKLKGFEGKNVKVVITEIERKDKRKWQSLSSVDLHGVYDKMNIRDIAYE
jgi:hypothetical protein